MAEFHGAEFEGSRTLRCDLCGEEIGVYWGEKPNPDVVRARCYQCAAVEEAEAVTRDAS